MVWTAPRVEPIDEPFAAGERPTLDGFLNRQRASLLLKCAGLTAGQLAERTSPPSNLSLLGLIRHIADVERTWFRIRFAGQHLASLYVRAEQPEAAFQEADAATAERDWTTLIAEQEAARRAVAALPLDTVYVSDRWGRMGLRWAYSHMIGEYAQHNGHADLLRENIDGKTAL